MDCTSGQDRQQAGYKRGGRGNGAIDCCSLHERSNNAQILLGLGSLVIHCWFTLYYKVKTCAITFFRLFLVPVITVDQNGEGTFTRKMMIIASAMMSLASMAPMFPSKLPH